MKWEKRLEEAYTHWGAWWIDGRGWGDLPAGTVLGVPDAVPGAADAPVMTIYSATNAGVAPKGTYGL